MKKKSKILLSVICFIIFVISIVVFLYNTGNIYAKKYKKLHISIDDTIEVFEDLTENEGKYGSIFDNYTLNLCKEMNESYGACFSFYCFFKNDKFSLSNCTRKFKDEFEQNSSWLRFNYHGFDEFEDPNSIKIDEYISRHKLFLYNMIEIVGENSFDNYTRLSFFHGSYEVIEYLSGYVEGFYTADDDRLSYYFDYSLNDYILTNLNYFDNDLQVNFMKTNIRLEYSNNPFKDLFFLNNEEIVIFTHENQIINGKAPGVWKIIEVCKYGYRYKCCFDFI